MYAWRTSYGPVELAFTDRLGGVSAARSDFAPADAICEMRQVHGARSVVAGTEREPEADAMVTAEDGVTLVVRVADCVPILFADRVARVVGVAHAGRKGLAAGVVQSAIQGMRGQGAVNIVAWIGPYICGACYEVPEEMRDEISTHIPATRATTSWGTPSLDLGAGVRDILIRSGVEIMESPTLCTRESVSLFSYRRDGDAAGRQAGLIRIRPERGEAA